MLFLDKPGPTVMLGNEFLWILLSCESFHLCLSPGPWRAVISSIRHQPRFEPSFDEHHPHWPLGYPELPRHFIAGQVGVKTVRLQPTLGPQGLVIKHFIQVLQEKSCQLFDKQEIIFLMAAYFFARENYRYHYYSLWSAVTTCFLSFYGQNMPNVVVWTLIGA